MAPRLSFVHTPGPSAGLITIIRGRLHLIERLAAIFVTFTGIYLIWYWYAAISERSTSGFVSRIERWQTRVASLLQDQGAGRLAILLIGVVAIGILISRRNRTITR